MARKFIIPLLLVLLSSCEKNQDPNGIVLKYYGDALEDIGYSIAATSDGYVIGGQITKVKRLDVNYIDIPNAIKQTGIVKVGSDGMMIWKNHYGKRLSGTGTKVISLDDGSIVVAGYVTDTVLLKKDIYIVKTAADSSNSIEKIFKMPGEQYATDIIKTTEGFLVLGSTDAAREPLTDSTGNNAGKKDLLFLRLNNNLDQIGLPEVFGYPGNDVGVAIKRDINGGYIVVGSTDRSDLKPDRQGKSNILIVRVNDFGNVTISKILGGLSDEYAADFEVLSDGYFIAGNIGAEGAIQQAFVWGISSDIYAAPLFGNPVDLEPDLATKSNVFVKAISRYKSNSFVMAGQYGTGASARMLLFVVDASGLYVDGKMKIFGGTGSQIANDVITDEQDNIIAVGKNSYENNSMISLLKFRF